MRQRWFSGAGILLSLILMALPCSVSMTAEWSDAGQTGACSYLSLHPILYGNWFPLLAVGFALLALVFLLLRRDFRQMTPVCLALAMISQVLSWILFASFSVTGAAAVLLQAAVLAQDVKAALALRT